MEDIDLVDWEKPEFEYREKLKLITFLDFFCLSIPMRDESHPGLSLKNPSKVTLAERIGRWFWIN